MRSRVIVLVGGALALALAAGATGCRARGAPDAAALAQRDRGLGLLESGRPDSAAPFFRDLAGKVRDPLGAANLAVAELRQQHFDDALGAIDRALALAPDRADLLSIRRAVLEGAGRAADALDAAEKARRAAPDDPRAAYAVFRLANASDGVEAEALLDPALDALRTLRPENLLVLLSVARRAVAAGDAARATDAVSRLGELSFGWPESALGALADATGALTRGDLVAAALPVQRLANVLAPTPAHRASLAELSLGVDAVPVERFAKEPPVAACPPTEPAPWFASSPVAKHAGPGGPVALADLDGDEQPDIVRVEGREGVEKKLVLRAAAGEWEASWSVAAPADASALVVADLDDDARRDVLVLAPSGVAAWRNEGEGRFEDATGARSLAGVGARAGVASDLDLDGDLDLAFLAPAGDGVTLLRNPGVGGLVNVSERLLPPVPLADARVVVATDVDRDGDPDLVVGHVHGVTVLENRLQAGFVAHAVDNLPDEPVTALASGDLDGDGRFDLVVGGASALAFLAGSPRGYQRATTSGWPPEIGHGATAIVLADLDADGILDVAARDARGAFAVRSRASTAPRTFGFEQAILGASSAAAATHLAIADLDGDGDLDGVASGITGLDRFDNRGSAPVHWLAVRLRGLRRGSAKNNVFGVGSLVEVRAEGARQVREADGNLVHFGLGCRVLPDLLRVVWTNGVPQSRLAPERDQLVVEEQVLKGSCPFLYAWNGREVAFVTDLLWGAPLGLPIGLGRYAPSDPDELVEVPGAVPRDGAYDLRVTEELWEAAWFDRSRLWVVDHPADVEVASSLGVGPGSDPAGPDRLVASRAPRPMASVLGDHGEDLTDLARERDERYASSYQPGPYQGVAAAPWTLTLDLGAAPGAPVRLHLAGWIFPADASLNLAIDQRSDLALAPPRLEVETEHGWIPLVDPMPSPAGKTKARVVVTPPLPSGAHRLRIVGTSWLAWDRIAWSVAPADDMLVIRAQLAPSSAELRARGFSRMVRRAPNAPHGYVFASPLTRSPWLPMPGAYTRYGDVRELLDEADDRYVILASGDELALRFDATGLPPPAPGTARSVFLQSFGWDKDADRNVFEARRVEPLPFGAMKGYPFTAADHPPDSPGWRAFRERWLTRVVSDEPAG